MDFLLFLMIFLSAVTVVGHCIWVGIAFLFRAALGAPSAKHRDMIAELNELFEAKLIDHETHRRVLHAMAMRRSKHRASTPEAPLPGQGYVRPPGSSPADRATTGVSTMPPPVKTEESIAKPNDKIDEPLTAELVAEPLEPAAPPSTPISVSSKGPADSIATRAKRYATARTVAAELTDDVDRSDSTSAHTNQDSNEPSPPRRTWTEWIAAFLEESNIRWGELVGGLLIISCSTALVISFWSEISARPLLKFGVFNSVIAALFMLGIHAARRWNLPSTSQGVLLIAMLLVPLNFLAIAAFTNGVQPDVTTVAGELFTISIFTWLGYSAATILTPRWPIGTLFGVVGLSALQLLVRRWCGPNTSVGVLRAMAGVTATIYFASHLPTTIALRKLIARPLPSPDDGKCEPTDQLASLASDAWKTMGLIAFSCLLCLSFLIVQSDQPAVAIHNVAVFTGFLAAPGLLISTLMFGKARELRLGTIGVTSCAIGIACLALLAIAVLLSWPQPGFMLITSAVAFLACTWASLESRSPAGHYAASPFLAAIVLLAGHVLLGGLPLEVSNPTETVRLLTSHLNGQLMIGALGIAAAASCGFRWFSKMGDSLAYARIAVIFAIVALCMAFATGFGRTGDPAGLIWIASGLGCGSLVFASTRRNLAFVWIGTGLILISSMQWFTFGFPVFDNWLDRLATSFLSLATILSLFRVACEWIARGDVDTGVDNAAAWRTTTFIAIVAAAVLLALRLGWSVNTASPSLLAWLSVTCLAASVSERSRAMLDGFQFAALFGCIVKLHQWQVMHELIGERLIDWLAPTGFYWQIILIAAFGSLSIGMRLLGQRLRKPNDESQSTKLVSISDLPTGLVAWFLFGSATVLCLAGAVYMVAPGFGQELALVRDISVGRIVPAASNFQFASIAHSAKSILPWLAWLTVLAGSVFAASSSPRSKQSNRRVLMQFGAVLGLVPFLMLAATFESGVAVASALRWTSAIYFMFGCSVIWMFRQPNTEEKLADMHFAFQTLLALASLPLLGMISTVVANASLFDSPSAIESFMLSLTALATVLASALAFATRNSVANRKTKTFHRWFATTAGMSLISLVIVGVTILAKTLANHPVVGPESFSVFRRMGLAGSYVTPMAMFAMGFVGTAYRLRSQGIAFVASMLCNVCATAALLFVRKGLLDQSQWIQLAEINAIIAAVSVIIWTKWQEGWRQGDAMPIDEAASKSADRNFVRIVFGIGCSFLGIGAIAIGSLVLFVVTPDLRNGFVPLLGLVATGFLALANSRLQGIQLADIRSVGPVVRMLVMTMGLLVLAALQDPASHLAYRLLLTGWIALPLIGLIIERRIGSSTNVANTVWQALCFGSLTLGSLFALRAMDIRQLSDWWTLGGLAAAAAASAILGLATAKTRFAYATALLCSVTANVWWELGPNNHSMRDFIRINLSGLALPTVWWSLAIWKLPQYLPNRARLQTYIRFVVVATCIATLVLAILTFAQGFAAPSMSSSPTLAWASLTCILVAVVASAFGRCGLRIGSLVYMLGLSAVGSYLESLRLTANDLIWGSCLALSAFGLMANYLASRREQLRAFVDRFAPQADNRQMSSLARRVSQIDLVTLSSVIIAIVVLGLGVLTQFTCDSQPIRLVAAQAILAQTFAIALLPVARWSSGRTFALLFAAFGLVAFGWSWLAHDQARILDRIVIAAVATAGLGFVYSVGLIKLVRKENSWTASAMQLVPWLAGATVTLIGTVLTIEAIAFIDGQAITISPASTIAVAGTLLAVAGGCIAFAIWPGRDPLGLVREKLGYYVYAAEFVFAMLFVHLRVSMPWLFVGLFQQIWPLVVMAIAFAGVGFAELVKRLGRTELASPLERTGVFLPLLPAIGIWVVPSEIGFSFLMLVTSVLYAVLATMRRSFGFGILAVACGNAGMWHLFSQQGIDLFEHPQVWLIPPALCVLAAASLNRKRLTESQSAAIRYACASTIYVSSTADIFINGVADAPWLPIILAALSIGGIFTGILLRIRAFLFLGISFLMVSLMTVVWFAAVDLQQTWIWYVCGIVSGALILTVFAFFEKKRLSITSTLDQLNEWRA